MGIIQDLMSGPATRALFTVNSPLDLVGIGFFLLILYVVVGGTLSMLYHQVKYVTHAVTHRTPPDLAGVHPYTKSLINGTAPELLRLRACNDRARKREILKGILHTLEVQDDSSIARALVKSLRRLA